MIRQATRQDKQQIINMMKLFRAESNIVQYQGLDNEPYWNRLLDTILAGAGIIYLEDDVGLIMAIITPTVWCDKTLGMQELAWYVIPEKRNTSIGYRLLKKYVEYGNKLKQEGRIVMFSMTKMVTSPDVKYSKFGFSKLEENWIQ
jgi:hypothetical protein